MGDLFNPNHTARNSVFDKTVHELQNTLKRLQLEISEAEVSHSNPFFLNTLI